MNLNTIDFKKTAKSISLKYNLPIEIAEEVLQENFIQALKHYDPKKSSLKSFLYSNTIREISDLKNKRVDKPSNIRTIEKAAKNLEDLYKTVDENTPELLLLENTENDNKLKMLNYAFNKLKDEQKKCLIEFYVKGEDPKDSAKKFKTTPLAFRERVKYAVRNLRKIYNFAEANWHLLSSELKRTLVNTLPADLTPSQKQKKR